ncbi:MAG: hypothetical protein ABWZ66_10055 [Pyrinomonadaceae bacterium]
MRKKQFINILSYVVVFLCASFCVLGQQNDANLKDKRITIRENKQPLGIVFKHLMENYDLQIGFEESTLDRDHNDYDFGTNLPALSVEKMESKDGNVKITVENWRVFKPSKHFFTLDTENERLEDVLNKIVGQMEHYKWEINSGVINIIPTQGRDEKFKKLLAINVSSFSFEKGQTIKEITSKIIALPEFKKFLSENNLYFTGSRFGSYMRLKAQYGRKLDDEMNWSNLTFQDLLNKITQIKKGGWLLKANDFQGSAEKEYIDIDI